jgi:hypothetical protein
MSAIAVSATAPRSGWRKLIGFNMLTGIVLGIVGWYVGHFIGDHIHGANLAYYSSEAGENDIAIMLGYFLGVVGFLVGLGWAIRRRWPSASPRRRAFSGTSRCRPTTRWSPSSTWWGSGCSSSSPG